MITKQFVAETKSKCLYYDVLRSEVLKTESMLSQTILDSEVIMPASPKQRITLARKIFNSWLSIYFSMKVGSGAEHRTKLKANKIVAIIFENLLHSIASQQHPQPDQPEPRSTQTRSLFFPASKKRNYCYQCFHHIQNKTCKIILYLYFHCLTPLVQSRALT